MLQSTESTATPSTAALTVKTEETEPVQTDKNLFAPISDAELAELTACIETGAARNKSGIKTVLRKIKAVSAVHMSVMAVVGVTTLIAMRLGIVSSTAGLSIIIALMPILLLVMQYNLRRGRTVHHSEQEQQQRAAQRLAEYEDIRVVAPLIDTLQGLHLGASSRLEVWQAFGRLSQRLNEEEALALGKERQRFLVLMMYAWDKYPDSSHLAANGNEPLLGVLHILAHLGLNSMEVLLGNRKITVSLMPILEKWAAGKELGQDPAVRLAAVACRDAIRTKQEMARSRAQLLRASTPSAARSDSLLRPAQGAEPTDPQELLRPDPAETEH